MADAKEKTVLDDMPNRVIKNSKEEAIAYLTSAYETYSDIGDHEIVSPIDATRNASGLGQDESGNLVFDDEIFPDDMNVMISVLTQRGEGTNGSTVKCITVAPVPTFESVLESEDGRNWLIGKFETEVNRAAVRPLQKKGADIQDVTVLDSMPKTLADYITSNRGGSSTLLEAFDEFWKAIKAGLASMSKPWKLANLSKREFKNAMASAAYAAHWYPTLEETGAKSETNPTGSLFVIAAQAFEMEAKKKGMDSSLFQTWLNTRNDVALEEADEEEEDEISLDNLSALMNADSDVSDAGDEADETESDEETPADEPVEEAVE